MFRYAPEKVQSDLARRIRDLAEAGQRPTALAEAMVDKDLVVYEVSHRATGEKRFFSDSEIEATGEPEVWEKQRPVIESRERRFLEVNGRRAVELQLADALAEDRETLFQQLQLEHQPIVLRAGAVDVAVAILNNPWITGLLFIVGLIALYVELSAPGISIGGLIALLCFVLFFWSRFLGGTADLLEVVLFVTGVVFIAVEVFAIPGFGAAGVLGLLMMVASVLMASQRFFIPGSSRQMETFATSLVVVACSAGAFLAAAAWLTRHFGTLPVLNRLVLQPSASPPGRLSAEHESGKPLGPAASPDGYEFDVGDWGVAASPLRPAGKMRYGNRLLDVVADGSFVDAGRPVRIVEIHGNRIVVRDVDDE
jgi:membrane-bound serine protease (ClpP class)